MNMSIRVWIIFSWIACLRQNNQNILRKIHIHTNTILQYENEFSGVCAIRRRQESRAFHNNCVISLAKFFAVDS